MPDATAAIRFALSQIGKPYVWGATGPDSYDCSGLMVDAFQHDGGISLPRTTQAMLADPSLTVINKGQLQPGDLVFPSTEHVQMYLGGGKVVEAPHSGLNVRVTGLGDVYAARRVTTPSSSDWSASPVSGTTPISDTTKTPGFTASDISQTVGVGLTNSFIDIMKPLLGWILWISEVTAGTAFIMFGVFVIAKKSNLIPEIGG